MKKRARILFTGALTCAAACAIVTGGLGTSGIRSGEAASGMTIVPVELVLLVDTSGSVDDVEYVVQKDGYAAAFRHRDLIHMIKEQGSIAVTYIEWDAHDRQHVRIDWTLLRNTGDCHAFANRIDRLERLSAGTTIMSSAVEFAVNSIRSNAYTGLRRVIDISGDGKCKNYRYYVEGDSGGQDRGTPWPSVRATLAGEIDAINAICITTDSDVADFYRDQVPFGDLHFTMRVATFEEFEDAILTKLRREIGPVPGLYD
jgi:hypothetical protein